MPLYTFVCRYRVAWPDGRQRWGIGAVTLDLADDASACAAAADFIDGLQWCLAGDPECDGADIDWIDAFPHPAQHCKVDSRWVDDPLLALVRPKS